MNWKNFLKDHEESYPVPRIKRNSGLWKNFDDEYLEKRSKFSFDEREQDYKNFVQSIFGKLEGFSNCPVCGSGLIKGHFQDKDGSITKQVKCRNVKCVYHEHPTLLKLTNFKQTNLGKRT